VLAREPRHFGAIMGVGLIMQDLGEDQRALDKVSQACDPSDFPQAWLRHRGLQWAAELLAAHDSSAKDR